MVRKLSHRFRHYGIRPDSVKPGTLADLAPVDPLNTPSVINVLGYGASGNKEMTFAHAAEIPAFAKDWNVTWIDVDGLGNTEMILSLAEVFGINRLSLEDIFDTGHAPKIEEFDQYIFMLLKNGVPGEYLGTEHIAIILMDKIVITFQERPGDSFNQVRERIRKGTGKICQFSADFLACALIDAVVEGYHPILNTIKKQLDAIEDTFIEATPRNIIRQIHDVKGDLLFLHSAIWPIHDITLTLSHDDMPFVKPATTHYLRDCQDQAKQVKDLSEFYRLIASDLMNTYLAFNDSKANEIMKVLTMVATIFIPLSFICGFYGMNFDPAVSPYNMPELKTRYGYPVVVMLMLMIVGGILYMFKRRGWIGRGVRDNRKNA